MSGIEIAMNDYFRMSNHAKRVAQDAIMLHTQEWTDEMNNALSRDEEDYEFEEVLNIFYKGYKERECYEFVQAILDAAKRYDIELKE
jgi:hypothetical protein